MEKIVEFLVTYFHFSADPLHNLILVGNLKVTSLHMKRPQIDLSVYLYELT